MSPWGALTDEGRAARRGVTTLFVVTGAALVYWWNEYGPDYLRAVLGLGSIAVGIGVWRNWRWARWLALGSCFLSVAIAFAMPVLLVLWRPFEQYGESSTRIALFTCAAAGAIAVIGYKGLGYFRSAAAWRAYSTNDRERKALAEESSSKVVKSAGVMAILLGLLAVERGVGMPSLPAAPTPEKLPDLVITALCVNDQYVVKAKVKNRGAGSDPGEFEISFNDIRGREGMDSWVGKVPAPGQSTYVVLNNAASHTEEEVATLAELLYVDSTHRIRESDESNNRSTLDIDFEYYSPAYLPPCP